jgi:hypothetical protein
MHQSPLCLPPSLIHLAVANEPMWPPPLPQHHPCRELLAALLICVIHSERREERSHERPDAPCSSATCGRC